MRKIILAAVVVVALQLGFSNTSSAQSSYTNALGMRVDFGTGGSFVGFSGKHFFNENSAGEAQILFGTGVTLIGLEYQYHGAIQNAEGLRWVAGLGPAIAIGSGVGSTTDLLFRPVVGLDYKINNVPLNLGFDWRPYFTTAKEASPKFQASRFGLAFRYAF